MSDQAINQQWRIIGPSSVQWSEIKDVFTQLYIVENRKLKDVRDILSQRHGFNASEKMFKRRIFDWKIRKNYKAKDKEIIAKKVKAAVNSGQDLQSLSFRGRPVKLDRVKRHYRTDKRFSRLLETLSHSPEEDDVTIDEPTKKEDTPSTTNNSMLGTWRDFASDAGQDEMSTQYDNGLVNTTISRNISPPTDFYAVECTLFHTRDAIQWHFNSFKPLKVKELALRFPRTVSEEVKTGRIDQASEFWLNLHHGFQHLETGNSTNAWTAFDRCCQMVQPLLMSAPLHLLSCVLLHFATSWQGLNELEHHLLDFVSSMASSVVGPGHPLALALGMIATADVRDHAVESIMDLVTQGYKSRRKVDNSSLFALRVDQIDMLRKRKKFPQALALCQQLVKDSQSMRKKRYRTALATLGRIFADQSEEFGVESVAHRILDNEASDTANANSGGTTAWACEQLGSLSLNRGEYVVAEAYLRRAVVMTVQRCPNRGPSMASLTERLATCLKLQANALYQLAGKSNFELWLSAIKPYLFSNVESTGLILGGWTEPKTTASPVNDRNDISSAPASSSPSSSSEPTAAAAATAAAWTRERWVVANTEACRFIRGTLAMNVIPHVRQHNTARALWHNLLWLYGEEAGIDTQGGPPGPVPGNDGTMHGGGGGSGSGGGSGGRAKLLAAMARKGASTDLKLDLDLSRDVGRDGVVPSPFQSPPLMPVIKASGGSSSASQSYGPFLEVPSFDGPEEEEEEEEQYEFEDDIVYVSPELEFQPQYQFPPSYYPPSPPPSLRHITDDNWRTTGSNAVPNRFYSDKNNNTISPIPTPSPSANLSLRTIDEGEEDAAVAAHQDGPHPGRRVDLSDSSVFIRGRRSFFSHPGAGVGGTGGGGGLLHATHSIVSADVSGERVAKIKARNPHIQSHPHDDNDTDDESDGSDDTAFRDDGNKKRSRPRPSSTLNFQRWFMNLSPKRGDKPPPSPPTPPSLSTAVALRRLNVDVARSGQGRLERGHRS